LVGDADVVRLAGDEDLFVAQERPGAPWLQAITDSNADSSG